MGLFSIFKRAPELKQTQYSGYSNPIFAVHFDGEKTPGEMGNIKDYYPDYFALRARSWQSYLESDIIQTIVGKYIIWVIGSGLRLQTEPIKELSTEFDSNILETKFRLFAKSKMSAYNKIDTIHSLAVKAFKEAKIGGDCLVVLRVKDAQLTVQVIDGDNLTTPFGVTTKNIQDGIELGKNGEHIAFHVYTKDGNIEEIPAKTNGIITAYMVYGSKYRLDEVRGIPAISANLETIKKLDRYKEATVGGAEERAKIPYYIHHKTGSTGSNPLTSSIANAMAGNKGIAPETATDTDTAQKIALTTQKSVFNMEIESELKSLESRQELNFEEFYTTNVKSICASLMIPYEVAYSMYDSNYSASRAAIKDWEHIKNVTTEHFSQQFYKPIYDLFFELQILTDDLNIPEYLQADELTKEAYRNARFVGVNVANIDPLKEIKAEREKLGELGKFIPLTTLEQATENVNGGEFAQNIERFTKELEQAKELIPKEDVKE